MSQIICISNSDVLKSVTKCFRDYIRIIKANYLAVEAPLYVSEDWLIVHKVVSMNDQRSQHK